MNFSENFPNKDEKKLVSCTIFYTVTSSSRKADDGLQKVSQTGQEMHMTPRDISNKHIMAYGNWNKKLTKALGVQLTVYKFRLKYD